MEYIEGESLSGLVQRIGALKEEDAIVYIKQVADALCYLHSRRIMHLDIKPSNIMLRHSDNQAILIDFGLSKHYSSYSGEATSTTPIGFSYGFAPMEQYKQGGVSEFSPETDIYSLGATLYYLVVGAVPPDAAAIAEDGLPKLPSKLSEGVRAAIEKSMSVNRKNRPHSINEFLELFNKRDDEEQSDESKRAILIALLIIIGVVVLIILIVKFWEYLLAILLLPLVLPALLKMK
jgi:serine/threonine protein kinase